MSKDTFYFSHDYNTRTDEKIKLLIRKHGMLGYGIWWSIIEDLYNNANALRMDCEGIAYELRTDIEIIKSIINDFDLFVFEDGFFGSKSIEERLEIRNEKSENARKSAYKRWDKCKRIANALENNANASKIDAIYKGKEIKEIKEKKEPEIEDLSFEIFWNMYDKKVGDKNKLIKKWNKLSKVERDLIMEYVPKYKEAQPDKTYRKNPETFLNNKSWNDEIIGTSNKQIIPEFRSA